MLAAGLDIGNSTTELVLVEWSGQSFRPVLARRIATAGHKGSAESLATAARLLAAAENDVGRKADAIAVANLHPVDTFGSPMPLDVESSGAVIRVDRGTTPAGCGFAAGEHVPLATATGPVPANPVIVSVPQDCDFECASNRVNALIQVGWPVAGLVVGSDDAVLISNRLQSDLPIADEAAVAELPPGVRIAVEVVPPGHTLSVLSDPIAVATALAIPGSRLPEVDEAVRKFSDNRSAALVEGPPGRLDINSSASVEFDGQLGPRTVRLDGPGIAEALARARPGTFRRLHFPTAPQHLSRDIADLHLVDLRRLEVTHFARQGVLRCDQLVLAALSAYPAHKAEDELATLTGRPVATVGSEARAAYLGASTTPGLVTDATVCDIGAGTIDVIQPDRAVTAAGGGELLTVGVAALLNIPRQIAEHVKRSPSARAHSEYLLEHENGERSFIREPLPLEAIGHLCTDSPAGKIPFDHYLSSELSPQEWRIARLFLKHHGVGANVVRCIGRALPADVFVLSGGGALDDEAVRAVRGALRADGSVVGRANVLGEFGPRYAVACGLIRMLAGKEEPGE